MRGLFGRRGFWSQQLKQKLQHLQSKPFCNSTNKEIGTTSNKEIAAIEPEFDPYKEVHNLNVEKALRILATEPRRKQRYGFDFHLVQFFFCCLPSLAVYLVALYARREMRIMDAELEKKKRTEEEAKAKERALKLAEETAANPVIIEVKGRLLKLEESVKEIVVETKKQRNNSEDKSLLGKSKKEPTPTKPNSSIDSKDSSSASQSKTSSNADGDASTRDLNNQSKGSSP